MGHDTIQHFSKENEQTHYRPYKPRINLLTWYKDDLIGVLFEVIADVYT